METVKQEQVLFFIILMQCLGDRKFPNDLIAWRHCRSSQNSWKKKNVNEKRTWHRGGNWRCQKPFSGTSASIKFLTKSLFSFFISSLFNLKSLAFISSPTNFIHVFASVYLFHFASDIYCCKFPKKKLRSSWCHWRTDEGSERCKKNNTAP